MSNLNPTARVKRKEKLAALLPPGFALKTGQGRDRVWIYQPGVDVHFAATFKSIDAAIAWLKAFTGKD